MAQKLIVSLTDDITGDEADETIVFAIDGTTYEIDLTSANAQEMRDRLGVYVEHGRKMKAGKEGSGRGARAALSHAKDGKITPEQRKGMQKFAQENGLRVPGDRGRIAQDVQDAWHAAGRPM